MFNFFRKKATIFYLLYESKGWRGYRREYFPRRKSLDELYQWLEEKEKEIDKKLGEEIIVLNFGIIKENY